MVRTDPVSPAIKSLTSCQDNRTRVGVKAVRTDPAAPAMKSLTSCQAKTGPSESVGSENRPSYACNIITHFLSSQHNQSGSEENENGLSCTHEITHKLSSKQHQSESEGTEKRPSCICYKITHMLSSEQDHSGSDGSENRSSCTCHKITHFLSCHPDQNGSEVRTDPGTPAMKSLTCC